MWREFNEFYSIEYHGDVYELFAKDSWQLSLSKMEAQVIVFYCINDNVKCKGIQKKLGRFVGKSLRRH